MVLPASPIVGDDVDHLGHVGLGVEVVLRADVLPAVGRAVLEHRARARSRAPAARTRPSAMPPAASAPPVMKPRRVTVSPSKAPGVPRSAV